MSTITARGFVPTADQTTDQTTKQRLLAEALADLAAQMTDGTSPWGMSEGQVYGLVAALLASGHEQAARAVTAAALGGEHPECLSAGELTQMFADVEDELDAVAADWGVVDLDAYPYTASVILADVLACLAQMMTAAPTVEGMTDDQVSALVTVLLASGHEQAAEAVFAARV